MARPATISYEQVSQVCEQLGAAGDRVSVRRVQQELGAGSMTTVLVHYRRWLDEQRAQQAALSATGDALSEQLRSALAMEIQRRQHEARAQLEADLAELREVYEVAQSGLAQTEERLSETITTLEAERAQRATQVRALEQELAAARARADNAEERATHAEEKADKELRNAELARVAAAESQLRAAGAAESVHSLTADNRELRASITGLQQSVAEAMRHAAVAEEHAKGRDEVAQALRAEGEDLRKRLAGAAEELKAYQQRLLEGAAQAADAERRGAVAEETVQGQRAEIESLRGRVTSATEELKGLQKRLSESVAEAAAAERRAAVAEERARGREELETLRERLGEVAPREEKKGKRPAKE